MKIDSKNLLYVISSVAIFLVSSTWLYILKEERIGVYAGVLFISVLSSGYIVNPKFKYQVIIDLIAIVCFILIIRLGILYFLLS